MLRLLVLVLLLANLGYYAWTAGHLQALVSRPPTPREPERLQRQVRPEIVQIETAPASPRAPAPAAAPAAAPQEEPASPTSGLPASAAEAAACLEIGPYTEAEYASVEATIAQALQGADWNVRREERGGVFLVYLGKYPSREALLRRQEELRAAGIQAEELRHSPGLEPGLTLGRFTSRESAERRALALADRGVRAARVLTISPPTVRVQVRIPAADAALRSRLDAAAPRLQGRRASPCSAEANART